MEKNTNKLAPLMLFCALTLTVITGCVAQASDTPQTATALAPVAVAGAQTGGEDVAEEDLEIGWDAAASTKISLNGSSATVSGAGATAKGGVVTVNAAGTYVLSGKLSNGQIAVAATNKDLVRLVLNGVEITNSTGAPVYASQCDKLIVTLAEGTANTLTDGGDSFKYAEETDEEPNAALFSKDDLVINGNGALTVNAGFNNGIGTKDDLLVAGGDLTVKAANHGLRGNDSVTVLGGAFAVDSVGDAIHSKGDINIGDGTFVLSTQDDGIHADGSLNVSGGEITVKESYEGLEAAYINISDGVLDITASDDAINAAGGSDGDAGDGRFGKDEFSAGGGYSINISGGTVKALASSDCLDSNGTVNISGGVVYALSNAARDGDAIDANGAVVFTGGTIVYGGSLNTGRITETGSTQSYVYVGESIASGSEVAVKKNGATLISFTAYSDCRVLALSSPEIVSGQSYEIYSGSKLIAEVTAGVGGSGMGAGMGGRPGGGAGDRLGGGKGNPGAFQGEPGTGPRAPGGGKPGGAPPIKQ